MNYKPGTPGQNQEASVCMEFLNAQMEEKRENMKLYNMYDHLIVILTQNSAGELYIIESDDYNEIVNDWNGDCCYVPENDARVFFASYNGTPINPYLYADFVSCMQYLRTIAKN